MQPAFAAPDEFEMLDGVCDVGLRARNSGFSQSLVQQTPGGPHEWPALPIFLIAGLLPDENNLCPLRSLTEDGLSCLFVEITSSARTRRLTQSLQSALCGKKILRRACFFLRFYRHFFQPNKDCVQIQMLWCQFGAACDGRYILIRLVS